MNPSAIEGRYIGRWTEVTDQSELERAVRCARGSYQLDILLGRESLSGSTLKGVAAGWGARYHRSRMALLGRMRAAGVRFSERRGPHGMRILVIGGGHG